MIIERKQAGGVSTRFFRPSFPSSVYEARTKRLIQNLASGAPLLSLPASRR